MLRLHEEVSAEERRIDNMGREADQQSIRILKHTHPNIYVWEYLGIVEHLRVPRIALPTSSQNPSMVRIFCLYVFL